MSGDDDTPLSPAQLGVGLLVLAAIHYFVLGDWGQALEVPWRGGMDAVSIARGLLFTVDLAVLVALLARVAGPAATRERGMSKGALRAVLVLALVPGFWLEASGAARQATIAAVKKVPGGPTRLQQYERLKADWAGRFASFAGPPQATAFFDGTWRRNGRLYFGDVRRVVVRDQGGQRLARIDYECGNTARECRTGEVAAKLIPAGDGIASLEVEAPFEEGRIWMRMGAGRTPRQPGVIATQVYLDRRPEVQVSSGGPVTIRREKPPVAPEAFVGTWTRAAPPVADDFTRLEVSRSANGLVVQAWGLCGGRTQCDLGRSPAATEVDAEGRVYSAEVLFQRPNINLRIVLEPPLGGVFEAESTVSRFGPVRGRITRRGGGSTSQSVSSRTERTALLPAP